MTFEPQTRFAKSGDAHIAWSWGDGPIDVVHVQGFVSNIELNWQERRMDGDYFGRTVNAASRIADYAMPGEVVVSQDVVDTARGTAVSFIEIGPVELKGMSKALRLYTAHREARGARI